MEESNVRRLRASQRFKLFLPTCMRLGHELVHCNILDLSVSGALVTATRPAAIGVTVFLRVGDRNRAARVVRRDGRQFGVEFAVQLSAEEVTALVEAERDAAVA